MHDGGVRATTIVLGLLLLAVGLLNVLKPDIGWRISTGRDATDPSKRPSDQALMTARVSGIAFAAIGAVLLFAGVFT